MRSLQKVITVLCYLAAIALLFGMIWPTCRVFRSFDNLERNARKVITATQLQTWATNLIAKPPTNNTPRVSQLGTNFPQQLLGLYHNPPSIVIYEGATNNDWVQPSWILLYWGGGVIGHCGFEIGPTNFISLKPKSKQWQPGVYFFSEP